MHPEPSEVPQNSIVPIQTTVLSPPHQHGLRNDLREPSSSSPARGDSREQSPLGDDAEFVSSSSSGSRRARRADLSRLSSDESASPGGSPANRIEKYEKLLAPRSRKRGSVSFEIIPSSKDSKNRISIDEFPNEVLTHILSQLPPETLSAMSLVCRRFHNLVTTPHAWRIAFARYFPGPEAVDSVVGSANFTIDTQEILRSDKRYFTRLSALASWRSEYILRTRLLRSLGRGKPAQFQSVSRTGNSRHGGGSQLAAVVTYDSGLVYPVSHLKATFGTGLNRKQPLFIHGAVEQGVATNSDPSAVKVGNWGLGDFQAFKHFADLFIGESEWGLGSGEMVGMPNVMDISQPYGKVYGEACPGGRLFFTSVGEQRGRFLAISSSPDHELGIPDASMIGCSVCSTWIAQSEPVLKATNGVFGFLAGFSNGILAAYALGVNPVHDRRYEKGELTAKWALSPGVPIIAIHIDPKISSRRLSHRRIWAVVLNALGEVFYLTEVPTRPEFKGKADSTETECFAWQTGRTVEWTLIEATRRTAKPDPYNTAAVDGSYTPRSSSYAMGLAVEQIVAETKEIEKFLLYKPKHFRNICEGWDMRRKLLVDFGGDDRHGAGESIFVLSCGLAEDKPSSIKRFTRRKTKIITDYDSEPYPAIHPVAKRSSLFGHSGILMHEDVVVSPSKSTPRSRTSSHESIIHDNFRVDWHISDFFFGGLKAVQISALNTDDSEISLLTASEDPLLGMSGGSNSSSPISSPLGDMAQPSTLSEIPGQRARFMAIGTTTGIVIIWNMRGPVSPAPDIVNAISPVRMIHTESPQIDCLALTSLYLVHGGNDGLVQAWDPLASSPLPIRTLNSRFSTRARRRLVQAAASAQGVGNNYYAAGAITLDPDPTVLRGMVSLGTHLRYWSYSSTAADAYKSSKRKPLSKRSERGSNAAANEQRFTHTGRGVLKDYIANEKQELEREKVVKQKENERLTGRFGIGLLGEGASEDEILAYATMLSEEAWNSDETKRRESEEQSIATSTSSETVLERSSTLVDEPISSSSSVPDVSPNSEDLDADVAEAIRLSLLENSEPAASVDDFPIRYSKKYHSTAVTPSEAGASGQSGSPSKDEEENDLRFALQLSLAEEESRQDGFMVEDEFPALDRRQSPQSSSDAGRGSRSRKGKGKGKSRAV